MAPLESTSGIDLSEEESSRSFTSLYVDWDDTNFTSLTMMSSTKMLYWLLDRHTQGKNLGLHTESLQSDKLYLKISFVLIFF